MKTCPECRGRGWRLAFFSTPLQLPCSWCERTGEMTDERYAQYEAELAKASDDKDGADDV